MRQEEKDGRFKPSDASQHIEGLLKQGKARTTPPRLKNKPKEWEFSAETEELPGYEATASEKSTSVNLDNQISNSRGDYTISHIGPVDRVVFDGKVGTAPKKNFRIIQKKHGRDTLGFLEEE